MSYEEDNIINDDCLKARIEMLIFLYQKDGTFANDDCFSVDDLIDVVCRKLYNILKQELIFYKDYTIAFDSNLYDTVKCYVRRYFKY